jgi:hypothetical protein
MELPRLLTLRGSVAQNAIDRAMTDHGNPVALKHEVSGHEYFGWYRRLPGRRVEVFTEGRTRVVLIESDDIETTARRVLEELIRGEEL